jgi:flavodoxin
MISVILTTLFAGQLASPAPQDTAVADSARVLVVFYSLTGTTKHVAKELAESLAADVEEIREVRSRNGVLDFIRSGYESVRKVLPPIKPFEKNPAEYRLVVLGTPVWAGGMSSPMRTYITQNRERFRAVALFCTQGGETEGSTFLDMTELCGKTPVATLSLRHESVAENTCAERLAEFADELRAALEY